MPGPAAFAIPGAIAAAKRMAFEASTYLYTTEAAAAFTSAAFVAFLANWIWKRLPVWVKEDISFKTLIRSTKNKDNVSTDTTVSPSKKDELSHLASVLEGIQRVIQSMETMHNIPQLHAAILAYIQWSGQFKQAQLHGEIDESLTRDYLYESSGQPFDIASLQTRQYQLPLELATWAYYQDSMRLEELLQARDMELIIHDQSERPGNVAYFVAICALTRKIYVSVRGTSTLEDIVTDCCGYAVPLRQDEECSRVEVEMEKPHEVIDEIHIDEVEIVSGHERITVQSDDTEGDNHVRCHHGILISAQRLTDKIIPIIMNWVLDAKYELLFCGHSLGAGAATLAAMIVRSKYPQLADRMHVYAFAPPPVLDHDSAIASAPFVTSVVRNADLIPRCSLYNLSIVLESLKLIHERLVEKDMNPTGPKSTAAFVQQLSKGMEGEVLLSPKEWKETVQTLESGVRKPDHLFVAGRVLLVYSPWNSESLDEETVTWLCTDTDGAAPALRTLEVGEPKLFTDHVLSSYFDILGMEYEFN